MCCLHVQGPGPSLDATNPTSWPRPPANKGHPFALSVPLEHTAERSRHLVDRAMGAEEAGAEWGPDLWTPSVPEGYECLTFPGRWVHTHVRMGVFVSGCLCHAYQSRL